MKRFIFSAIALIVAATSCTESGLIDTPDMYGSAIVFDTYIGKTPITKAENVDLSYLESAALNGGGARVYAFMSEKENRNPDFTSAYMDGRIVCKTPTTYKEDGTVDRYGEWKYEASDENNTTWTEEEVYWPGDVDLAFAAYNLKADSRITNRSTDMTEFDFTIAENISDQVDLLATDLTYVSETDNSDTKVSLRFHHLLSRVGFSVIATNPNDNVDIAIQSLRLCGTFSKKGRVDLKSATAAIQPDSEDYRTYYDFFQAGQVFTVNSNVCGSEVGENSIIYANKKFNQSATEWEDMYVTPSSTDFTPNANDRFMMIMPEQLDGAYIEVEYQLTGAEKRFAKVELGSMPLKAGFAYEFVFRIATASIEFSGVVEGDWGSTGTNGNTNIPQEN